MKTKLVLSAMMLALAVPAVASDFSVQFPTLTFPTQPDTETTQGCFDPTAIDATVCPAK